MLSSSINEWMSFALGADRPFKYQFITYGGHENIDPKKLPIEAAAPAPKSQSLTASWMDPGPFTEESHSTERVHRYAMTVRHWLLSDINTVLLSWIYANDTAALLAQMRDLWEVRGPKTPMIGFPRTKIKYHVQGRQKP